MTRPAIRFCILAALSLIAELGCSAEGTPRPGSGSGDGGASTMDAGPPPDGALPRPPDGWMDGPLTRDQFCMGKGPPVRVGDDSMPVAVCAGTIASRVFSSSLCTCTDANIAGYLRTRSFHSGMGTTDTASGAPVGINQRYVTGGYADVGGTFTIAGTEGVTFAGYLKVGGDFKIAGNVEAAGYITIERDAWVAGNIRALGVLDVSRDLRQPSGRSLMAFPQIGGSHIREAVTVNPPCDCTETGLIDIDGIVDAARTNNDNADIGLPTNELSNVVGIGVDRTLPCGRFYIDSVGGLGGITLHIPGRTALFVGGDVNAVGAFEIEMGPEGELDLFIKGNLLSIGAGSFGHRDRPAATRIYVGGSGDVTLIGASGFVGNVYAPHARITAPGATTVYGSLFGRQVDMPGYLEVRYDRAILEAGDACDNPEDCTRCSNTCPNNQACVAGECRACSTDADCCEPLVCYPDGSCGPLLL